MSKEKPATKVCKHCKTEIPYGAKVCPQCRKKQAPGGCLIAVIVFIALGLIGSCFGGGDSDSAKTSTKTSTTAQKETTEEETTTEVINYTPYTVTQMMDDLSGNAMNAADTYKDQYIEITGKLSNIDSSGKYISLAPDTGFSISGVQCYIKNDEQKEAVKTMTVDDTITLRGKCTSVGEVMGYSLDIDSIN